MSSQCGFWSLRNACVTCQATYEDGISFRASEGLDWPNIDVDETETDIRVTAELPGSGGKGHQPGNREWQAATALTR
jgi:hypothetical protein